MLSKIEYFPEQFEKDIAYKNSIIFSVKIHIFQKFVKNPSKWREI